MAAAGSTPRRPWRRVGLVLAAGLAGLAVVVLALAERQRRLDRRLAGEHEAADREGRSPEENAARDAYRVALRLAAAELGAGRLEPARAALQRCPEELRGFEWSLLGRMADDAAAPQATPRAYADLHADTPSANDLDLSPDGGLCAVALDDGRALVYDLATGQRLQTLTGHSAPVLGVSFAADSRRLASCSGQVDGEGDASVRVWDTASGEALALLTGHASAVCGVAFSPDGRHVASVSGAARSRADDTLRLWDVETRACLQIATGHTNLVSCVTYSPDGALIATGSFDETVRLWAASTGAPLRTLLGHRSSVVSLAFSPDGRVLASGAGNAINPGEHTVRLWDVASGRQLTVLSGHASPIFALAFSPDGERLASGSGNVPLPIMDRGPGDTSLRLWEAASGELLLTLPGPGLPGLERSIWELGFTLDGSRLLTACDDGRVRQWFGR